ncbi:hypothetical protein, partial [Klebsiella pneumoniae]|uniref:hypothetical protein n=1 Tax=Klebsiella pneumoniae TaxID=573 RepID=UPI001D0CED83
YSTKPDKGWDARKRAYCLKIQPATGSFARNLIYSTKPDKGWDARKRAYCLKIQPATGSFARNLIYSTKPSLPFMGMSSCGL